MIKFIHTADIHFGMENYGRIDPQTGIHTRLLDFETALNFCIDHAINNSFDFFLFSGDAYKTANPTPTQQRLLLNCFLRLYKSGIPVVIIIGNHDNPLSFGKAHALDIFGQLPIDGFHVISKPEILNLKTKNGNIQIVGIPWPVRGNIATSNEHLNSSSLELTTYISGAISSIIKKFAAQLDKNIPAVLAGHLTVTSGIFSGSEKRAIYGTDPLFLPSQLAIEPFDYVALGHLHRHQDLNPNGYPAVVYSGSIERIDFGERKEEKGFCTVYIPEKNKAYYEFIKVPIRKFIQIEVELNATEDQTEQLIREISNHDINNAVLKIVYKVPLGHKDRVDLQRVQAVCASAIFIAAIIPIMSIEHKERRAALKVDMDLASLLNSYFETKPEYKKQKDKLILKALDLEQQCYDNES